ncbi:hypothetical protein [Mesorhizobium sp. L103C119B0]|uniref:hypothetical protein n=1 Tax=Mesorhizobium sp. L103C119B0 TaxID=1287085 RepID=UPI00042A2B2E|nr:hypothetical protein [Mesorhizobium sp. L103C119B0]
MLTKNLFVCAAAEIDRAVLSRRRHRPSEAIGLDHFFHRRMAVRSGLVLMAFMILAFPPQALAFKPGGCLRVVGVDRWDFLYIRERPDHRSAKVGAIDPESISPIVITAACTPAGAPPRQLWCPIKYYVTKEAIRRGFVKAFYTKEVPCPPSLDFYRE